MHARYDTQGRPLGFVPTGGQVSDYEATDTLMKPPFPEPQNHAGRRGYDSDCFRQDLLIHGILPIIPPRKEPQCSTENRLAALQGPQPHRINGQQAQVGAPHHDPLRQDCPVLHRFPLPRPRKVLGWAFCQHAISILGEKHAIRHRKPSSFISDDYGSKIGIKKTLSRQGAFYTLEFIGVRH
ncbi:hypothetical protein [Gluconobacter cerinus]|uniref:hypothetical protein n=1 Tax=Gluconobacter cerinus TaxID=38307 RepID=UPI003AB2D704